MRPSWLILASSCTNASSNAYAMSHKATLIPVRKYVLSPPHQQQMQLDRPRFRQLEEINFENNLRVARLPIPSSDVRFCDRNGDRRSPNLSQESFSLLTDCSTSERGKFCGANETTVQRLRGAGRKNCRLTTFHVPCVPVCYSMSVSAMSVRARSIHPVRLG